LGTSSLSACYPGLLVLVPLAGKERERSREEETVEPWKVTTEHQEEKERIFFCN
jgi:hypothetical protein